ncbi:MAG: tetraacyldisaccharide 4'-kinase, partial [Candidatus Limisoma sp.]
MKEYLRITREVILTPLSYIYGAITYVRNKLFDLKILKSEEFDIPIISIGNLAVGGTGK